MTEQMTAVVSVEYGQDRKIESAAKAEQQEGLVTTAKTSLPPKPEWKNKMWPTNEEEANYDVAYHGDDPDMHYLLVQTVARLPEKVAAYVFQHCIFISVGRANFGFVLSGKIVIDYLAKSLCGGWLIFLTEDLPDGDSHSIIAHEIAHAYLKHDRYDPNIGIECEVEAAELTKLWGFTGKGADIGYCTNL